MRGLRRISKERVLSPGRRTGVQRCVAWPVDPIFSPPSRSLAVRFLRSDTITSAGTNNNLIFLRWFPCSSAANEKKAKMLVKFVFADA